MDEFATVGQGALAGAGKGALLGANPLLMGATGGLSPLIGAAGGALVGGISAGAKQKKANEAQKIPMVDPMEAARLTELNQIRKNLMAGTDAMTRQNIGDIGNQAATTMGAISRNTAGDVGGTLNALLKAQNSAQGAINQASVQGQQRLPYFENASNLLNTRLAQRRLELQLLKRSQALAENAQARKDANVSGNAILSSGVLDGIKLPSQGGQVVPSQAFNMLTSINSAL
jgi:hypothetical protein